MYLTKILLENVASINLIDLILPFNDNGTPQPLIIVGINGSGKSILLSYIADALIEFAKKAYTDIVPLGYLPIYSPYFKFNGGLNQNIHSEFSIGLLEFIYEQQKYFYIDKTGKLDHNQYSDKIKNRFESLPSWELESNEKKISPENKKVFEICFDKNVFCYFPPNRNELPHWLNSEGIHKTPSFKLENKISGKLNKPIYIESSIEQNKSWILDIFLDSMIDFEATINHQNPNQINFMLPNDSITSGKIFLKKSRENIEKIFQTIFQDESIKLAVNYRQISPYRLCLMKENQVFIPSLNNLSSGQSILFNLFANIIRYADKSDINKSINIHEIEGIVIIDEIDAHLHSNLQYETLPKLIQLFPKVQFIITTHSPLFILGMENEYQGRGFKIIEMPQGNQITTERFSEFKKSFDYYKNTKTFEDTVKETIKTGIKPKVLTEGETDPIYIKTFLELLGHQDILDKIDIEWVGTTIAKGKNLNSGDTGLNHTRNVLIANPDFLNRKVLLLYDCDTNKSKEDIGYLSVRCLKKRENAKIKKGIENLIPDELCIDDYYETKTTPREDGGETTIKELKKPEFCKWICKERKNNKDFIYFTQIKDILQDFLNAQLSSDIQNI